MKRPFRLVILAGILLVLFYFVRESFFNDDNYIKPLLKEREDKDLTFRSRDNTPFESEDRQKFRNLVYYEPNTAYRIKADVKRLEKQDTLHMPLTDGNTEAYLRYAIATFKLEGQPQQLTLYKKIAKGEEEETFFVPFTDKTNGFDTYGGGRYLDIPFKEDPKTVLLDFNRAYSPFCAYNPEYVCPVPPRDNHLPVAIPAGEKTYEHKE
ncbi:DUF1684 domain-containing protein [Pontibacter beigongshangensis]|uniref:DUF1684 domain-containing protein n=1 Tax=Pontibacter beigongshangensis TaxID=2574733 RepID=UPI0016504EA7|nr:DUF1684 domain-containing protein [Pontibacter beigongshangensis]